jgi:hypothetical protein
MARAKKLAAYGVAVLLLLAVFALYTQPQMMVRLSDFIWACFGTT